MKTKLLPLKVIAGLYLLLMIPLPQKTTELQIASEKPFTWNQDVLWADLEEAFNKASGLSTTELDSLVRISKVDMELLIENLEREALEPNDSLYRVAEERFFHLSVLIASQQRKSGWYYDFYNRIRKKIKTDSQHWDMGSATARNTAYRILYGMRAAVEEVMLQSDDDDFLSTMLVTDESSVTPSAKVMGIEVHSGDLLVSRGGAEVSAFISRGNDYPGNFSHVAMVHIDERTRQAQFIEAHIERGVAIADLDQYLDDKKLRVMVMRPRADLGLMLKDPMLPHKASAYILERSRKEHIPYDFKMDYYDDSAMFCSEVGSNAYRQFDIDLWEFRSTISSQGIVEWLNAFGVEHFVTQMPSDLEYDPSFSIVAEWRDKETLFQDHIDNAVMDALIGQANAGESLDYNIWALPLARLVKLYSSILNIAGKEGVIPEGMTPIMALKNNDFVKRFQNCKELTEIKIEEFIAEIGYLPPYWQLVRMAEGSIEN